MNKLFSLPARLLTLLVTLVVMAILTVSTMVQGKQKHFGLRYGTKGQAVSTQGYKLEVSVDGTAYTEVSNITDIVDPTGEASDLDATNLRSTSKEYIAGLRDSQSVTITGQRVADDAGQNILRDNAGASTPLYWRNTYSDGEIQEFRATCKKFGVTGGVDAVMMFTSSIRATGTPEWNPTT